MNRPNTLQFLSFCAVIYIVMLVITLVGYPLGQTFLKPMLANIMPVSEHTSVTKALICLTVLYWGMVIGYWAMIQNRKVS